MIVTTLQVGLQLANVSQAWQLGVIGVLLIGSVGINTLLGRQSLGQSLGRLLGQAK